MFFFLYIQLNFQQIKQPGALLKTSALIRTYVHICIRTHKDMPTWACNCTQTTSRDHTYCLSSSSHPHHTHTHTRACTNAHVSIPIISTHCLRYLASSPWFNLFALKASLKAADPARRSTLDWSVLTPWAWPGPPSLVLIWGLDVWAHVPWGYRKNDMLKTVQAGHGVPLNPIWQMSMVIN